VRWRWIIALWLCAALFQGWWVAHNPLPDGFQNEYLLLGNAMDLWGALTSGDLWHMRWYMYTGYWPWGFFAVPWPFMSVLGPTRLALVMGNLIHLAVLLAAVNIMGRALGARWAPVLVLLCPGVFGSLVRFEPNLADIAWTAAGLACLVRSRDLRDRRMVLGWGACLGIGLMMDRLAVGFFLVPALLPLLWRANRKSWTHLAMGLGVTLLLTGAYYREFFIRHTSELLSQAPVGEIDSAGTLSGGGGLLDWFYYPLALVDSQAGPVLGALMIWGLIGRLRGPRAVLLCSVGGGLLVFTLIAKNQVFYTLPILGPLAVLAATRGRWVALGVVGGLWTLLSVGIGAQDKVLSYVNHSWDGLDSQPLELPEIVMGRPWLPASWVQPRHTLARPPSHQDWPLEEALAALGPDPGSIAVLSEDHMLFEGFVVLAAREAWPDAEVRGVVLDPHGTFEQLADVDRLLWVGPRGGHRPTQAGIEAELLSDHYTLSSLPPVAAEVENQAQGFDEAGRWSAGEVDVVAMKRR